jgi:hypothetical protein
MRLTGSGRVWILTSALMALALVLTWSVRDLPSVETPVHIAWPVLIPFVYLAEVTVVHLQFRKDAHTFSMNEVPLIVGLFFMDPIGLIGAQIIGNALALGIHRRQSAIKLMFNLTLMTLQTTAAVIVFRAILGGSDPRGTAALIGILAATGVQVVIANILINAAILLTGGDIDRSEQASVLTLGAVTGMMNALVGLVAITVMWIGSSVAWAAAIPPVILYLGYRAYLTAVREHEQLQALDEAATALHGSSRVDSAMLTAATHARSIFEAERAETLIFPEGDTSDGYRTRVGPGDREDTMEGIRADASSGAWHKTLDSDESQLLPAADGRRWTLWRSASHEMVAPIYGPDDTKGVLIVADPLGDVRTFTSRDLRFLETLANQVSMSLENGRFKVSKTRDRDARRPRNHENGKGQ